MARLLATPRMRLVFVAVLLVSVASCKKGSPTQPGPCTSAECAPVQAPALTCGQGVAMTTASHTVTSAPITYASPVVTGGTQPVSLTCTPSSGSTFEKGTTQVTCTATDAIQRQATCSFSVTVDVPAPPIPVLRGTTFLAFGDSLTKGDNGCNVLDCDNLAQPPPTTPPQPQLIDVGYEYPTILQTLLNARYTKQRVTVIESGAGGETAAAGSYRLPAELARYAPDAVLILEGVNEFHPTNGNSARDVAESLRAQVRIAKNAGVKQVFVATLPPEIPGLKRAWGEVHLDEVNSRIKAVVVDENVVLVDVFAGLSTNVPVYISSPESYGACCSGGGIEFDGMHLTRAGRAEVARLFFDAIKANFEEPAATSRANAPARRPLAGPAVR